MPGVHSFRSWRATLVACCILCAGDISAQQSTSSVADPSSSAAVHTSLRICLRLADESSFGGPARVRLRNAEGRETPGVQGPDGDFFFSDVAPRDYTIEATAPGFSPVHQQIEIEDQRSLTRFLVMNPKSVRPAESPSLLPEVEVAPPLIASWLPPGIDEKVPYVDPDEPCPLQEITAGTGKRMMEFVSNLEKFSASERVEHYPVDILGIRRDPQIRNFNYVVTVSRTSKGVFLLDEYRNGSADPGQFPAHIATVGMEFAIPMKDETGNLAISADGRMLVYAVPDEASGENILKVQPIGSDTVTALAGTEGATYPFFSPDARYVGFYAAGKLKKISASGGSVQVLANASSGRGGTWGSQGVIVYAPDAGGALWRINANGTGAAPLTAAQFVKGEASHRWPFFLPDGEHFLYWAGQFVNSPDDHISGIYMGSLKGGEKKFVEHSLSNPSYANGYLFYMICAVTGASRIPSRKCPVATK